MQLDINNRIFTTEAEFTETLFKPINGKTACGYYKKVPSGGIKLFKGNGELFSAIVDNKYNEQFFVTARKQQDGKTFYMFGLSTPDVEFLGLDKLSYSENINLARNIINQVKGN